jgi:probable phosphoglycerate mutase
MRELVLVRHGHSDNIVRGYTGGWTDAHLTDLGRVQARLAAEKLADMLNGRWYEFYTSDQDRCVETATIISEYIDKPAVFAPELREHNLGAANNVTTAEAKRMSLASASGPLVDAVIFPGAETWRQMMMRVFGFLDRIDREGHDVSVLVTHSGASMAVVYWWLGLSPDHWPRVQFELGLGGITYLAAGNFDGRRIIRLNDVTHLAEFR